MNEFCFCHKDMTRDIPGLFEETDTVEIFDCKTLGPLLVKAGLFPSLTQAKKNNWDKEIPPGWSKFVIGKNRIKLFIWNFFQFTEEKNT